MRKGRGRANVEDMLVYILRQDESWDGEWSRKEVAVAKSGRNATCMTASGAIEKDVPHPR